LAKKFAIFLVIDATNKAGGVNILSVCKQKKKKKRPGMEQILRGCEITPHGLPTTVDPASTHGSK
jgi:hypothetical protein